MVNINTLEELTKQLATKRNWRGLLYSTPGIFLLASAAGYAINTQETYTPNASPIDDLCMAGLAGVLAGMMAAGIKYQRALRSLHPEHPTE